MIDEDACLTDEEKIGKPTSKRNSSSWPKERKYNETNRISEATDTSFSINMTDEDKRMRINYTLSIRTDRVRVYNLISMRIVKYFKNVPQG